MSAIPLTTPGRVPIFDGHNDVLLRLHRRGGAKTAGAFLDGEAKGHLDLPKARQGGFAGGLFAIFVPSTARPTSGNGSAPSDTAFSDVPSPPAVEMTAAQAAVYGMVSLLLRIERESQGRVRVCSSVDDIRRSFADDVLASVLHIEGAEAIDPDFELLDVLHEAGLRSLGPVWSRPNAFGHGVPFLCPSSPDTGPGLTALGKELVGACNRLKILIDLSHLNEKGFWDVAETSNAPLVATHSNAHALSPHSRNLTDEQLAAIRGTGGMVGVNFATSFLRADGRADGDTPAELVIDHLEYMLERVGEDGVGFGSDFDGARVPAGIGNAAGLQHLVEIMRARDYGERLIAKVCSGNWLRVLERTWEGAETANASSRNIPPAGKDRAPRRTARRAAK
ncbi:MAG: rane dipeptidase [Alphaproteobacteria bacterium]|nr:rane dipeptidase [Alphaproteobacteria bacterium]